MPSRSELADAVITALDALDIADAPHGLYAGHDLDPLRTPTSLYREWTVGLWPALQQLGATDVYARSPFAQPSFHLPEVGRCALHIRRIALIKVRRFGSAYRVDDRADRSARWADADVATLLNRLRYPRAGRFHPVPLVVLIGFAREATPLGRELQQLTRETRGLESARRAWVDRYGRAFSVGVSVWWAPPGVPAV